MEMVVETIMCSEAVSRSHWIRLGVTTVTMGHKRMAVAGKMSDTFPEAYRSLPQ